MKYLEKSAVIGGGLDQYRYVLTRVWDRELDPIVFVMLNPSTADSDKDDPTIRKCVDFAWRWGFGSLVVVNLFAWRATNPKELRNVRDPVGPENNDHIVLQVTGRKTVCAWGSSFTSWKTWHHVHRPRRFFRQVEGLTKLRHLGLNKDGQPKHPLYLPLGTKRKKLKVMV